MHENMKLRQGVMVVHTFNLSSGGRCRWISKFKARLVYRVSSRIDN